MLIYKLSNVVPSPNILYYLIQYKILYDATQDTTWYLKSFSFDPICSSTIRLLIQKDPKIYSKLKLFLLTSCS